MKVSANINVSKAQILETISQEDIFEKYLGIRPEFSTGFTNPLRNDDSPDCRFYVDTRGMIKFHDIAMKWNWDCFNLVQIVNNNCTFIEALRIIATDFNIGENKSINKITDYRKEVVKVPVEIKIRVKGISKFDREFWKFLTKEDFYNYQIYPLEIVEMKSAGGHNRYVCSLNDPAYAYNFGRLPDGRDDLKIYFPLRKKNRFLHSEPSTLQGTFLLPEYGDHCCITKSFKDVVYMHKCGLTAVAPKAETILLRKNQFNILDNRFIYLWSLYDNDRTGRKNAVKTKMMYGIQPYMFNKTMSKDFTDNLFVMNSIDQMKKEIDRFKEIFLI